MKFFLLIILFVVFVFIGIFVWATYYYRNLFFKDMEYVCKYFKNNISFNKNNLGDLFQIVENNISSITKSYLKNEKNIKGMLLKKKDIELCREFVRSLGKGDVEWELNNITYYENIFEENKHSSKNELDKNGSMYFKLIIGIGLAVCIILI